MVAFLLGKFLIERLPYTIFVRFDVNPVLAKELSEAHCEVITGFVVRIDFDAKRIGTGQNERISCEFCWVCALVGKTIPGDCAVIDFERGVAMKRVLISKIDLTELESTLWKRV